MTQESAQQQSNYLKENLGKSTTMDIKEACWTAAQDEKW
jgi:hypothetical protein